MFDLLKSLIDISSLTGSEGEIAHWVSQWLTSRGYDVRHQFVSEGRYNILACSAARPLVLFCTHLDTVPPHQPFHEDAERIYGRGACDAKGILFAMLLAAERLRHHTPASFGFLLVVGEEHASDGAKKAAELDLNTEYIILGEPTDNHLVSYQKGALVFRMIASGVSGHSGYPAHGHSALHQLTQTLSAWLQTDWGRHPDLGETTLNIGRMIGGCAANIIADHAEAEGLFRLCGDPEEIIRRIKTFENDHLQVQVLSASPAQKLMTLPGFPQKTVSFGSDAAYLKPLGKVLMIGPGSIHYAHRDDEQILKKDLFAAVDIYEKITKILLSEEKR